jgi:hypothetical protein
VGICDIFIFTNLDTVARNRAESGPSYGRFPEDTLEVMNAVPDFCKFGRVMFDDGFFALTF